MKTIKMQKSTYEKLQKHKKILEDTLQKVILEVNIARERGDLRENAEYNAAKSSKFHLESELSALNQKLLHATIVTQIVLKDFITFGNTVLLEDINTKKEFTYTILGEEEADLSVGKISCDSLLGKNILGKKNNETFTFSTPNGPREFLIKSFFVKEDEY